MKKHFCSNGDVTVRMTVNEFVSLCMLLESRGEYDFDTEGMRSSLSSFCGLQSLRQNNQY